MHNHRLLVFLVLLLSFTSAHALTAVCKEPTGRILGVHGVLFKGKSFDEPDGIKGAAFTILWKRGQQQTQIVSQSSGGGAPANETAFVVFESEEQISFLVLYESAVWLYSVFPGPKVLLITSHNDGALSDSGGAVVKSFKAPCEVSAE